MKTASVFNKCIRILLISLNGNFAIVFIYNPMSDDYKHNNFVQYTLFYIILIILSLYKM